MVLDPFFVPFLEDFFDPFLEDFLEDIFEDTRFIVTILTMSSVEFIILIKIFSKLIYKSIFIFFISSLILYSMMVNGNESS